MPKCSTTTYTGPALRKHIDTIIGDRRFGDPTDNRRWRCHHKQYQVLALGSSIWIAKDFALSVRDWHPCDWWADNVRAAFLIWASNHRTDPIAMGELSASKVGPHDTLHRFNWVVPPNGKLYVLDVGWHELPDLAWVYEISDEDDEFLDLYT